MKTRYSTTISLRTTRLSVLMPITLSSTDRQSSLVAFFPQQVLLLLQYKLPHYIATRNWCKNRFILSSVHILLFYFDSYMDSPHQLRYVAVEYTPGPSCREKSCVNTSWRSPTKNCMYRNVYFYLPQALNGYCIQDSINVHTPYLYASCVAFAQ